MWRSTLPHREPVSPIWGWLKMSSYQYRKSHSADKTVIRPPCLHNEVSYTGKTTSLYWIRARYLVEFFPRVYLDHRGLFVCAPSQWETRLQCNVVPYSLSACTEWSLGYSDHGDGLWFDKYISGCHCLCLYFLLLRKDLLGTFRVRKGADGFGLYKQTTICRNAFCHQRNQQGFLGIVFIVNQRSC